MKAHLLMLSLVYLRNAAFTSGCDELSPLITGPDGVQDDQLSASSDNGKDSLPQHSRFTSESAWGKTLSGSDNDPWLQVTFGESHTIVAIETMGHASYAEYVESYNISYSPDGSAWNWVTSNGIIHTRFSVLNHRIDTADDVNRTLQQQGASSATGKRRVSQFAGNTNHYDPVRNDFDPPIVARSLKIHPVDIYMFCSTRWELYKCLNLDSPKERIRRRSGISFMCITLMMGIS
ncbi:hypothetical protein CAPTEDRAFT_193138 [Capitella teleta]|uniref:F5/8 type C domain-containing protein n=1 Tax=Capitella teleta TaxID=283909 RepID=R7UMK5_CAPTE|nr:hypothetical protein CAPTEDRAFT_193138 [Capitella teleta]|eukprot:ELU07769.1 hypothetical protein CAPTEDRAFT_193138 [Capitella teleta]